MDLFECRRPLQQVFSFDEKHVCVVTANIVKQRHVDLYCARIARLNVHRGRLHRFFQQMRRRRVGPLGRHRIGFKRDFHQVLGQGVCANQYLHLRLWGCLHQRSNRRGDHRQRVDGWSLCVDLLKWDLQVERNVLRMVAPGFSAGAKRLCGPSGVGVSGNIFHPPRQRAHGITRQAEHVGMGWALFRQSGIDQLLHGPGSLAELGQTHHARTAFEGVECTAQRGEIFQVGWLHFQQPYRVQTVANHLTGLFQKDVQQFIFFAVFTDWSAGSWGAGWRYDGLRQINGYWHMNSIQLCLP